MNIEKTINIIRQYNNSGNFIESKKLLDVLISEKSNRNNVAVILENGQLLYGLCNFLEAEKYFKKVLKNEKNNIYAYIGLCKCGIYYAQYKKLKNNVNAIKEIFGKKEKNKRKKIFSDVINEIVFNKLLKTKWTNQNLCLLKILKENINELGIKKKIDIVKNISLYLQLRNKFNEESVFLKNIINSGKTNSDINKLYIKSLILQKKYKQAYEQLFFLKITDQKLKDDIINNLINISIGDFSEDLTVDEMLDCYFKLCKIKYLQKDLSFIKKRNSLLRRILVSVRQQNFKMKDNVYDYILKHTDKKYFNITNSVKNEIEWERKKIILDSKPRVAQIMLTDKCNSKCNMCDIWKKHKWELNDKGFENVSKILKYLDSITWQGGEVKFYPRFLELVRLAKKYNVSQHIITNGIGWDEKSIKEIICDDMNIAVSIDGFNREKYQYIRGIDCFEEVKNFILMFNRNRTPQTRLKLYTTVMRTNIDQLNYIYDFVVENRIDEVVLSPLKKLADNDFFYKENIFFKYDGISFAEYSTEIAAVKENVEKLSKKMSEIKVNLISYLPDIAEYKNTDDPLRNCDCKQNDILNLDNIVCQAPWKYIAVMENGFVSPSFSCGQPLILGDINSCDILKLWNSKKMKMIRKDIINMDQKKWCGICKSLSC